MTAIEKEVLLTDIYETVADFSPDDDSVYVARHGVEERSDHASRFETRDNVCYANILDDQPTEFSVSIDNGTPSRVQLRSQSGLDAFWNQLPCKRVYLDITGLRHHVWIPLLSAAVRTCCNLEPIRKPACRRIPEHVILPDVTQAGMKERKEARDGCVGEVPDVG